MLVLGIGNSMRGDDGVGPAVAARVAGLGLPGVEVVTDGEPTSLLDHLGQPSPPDVVVVVDATAPGPEPGRVRVHQVGPERLVRPGPASGSHGLGVADVVELARALGLLPGRLTLVGVEAESMRLGEGLSEAVRRSVGDAVRAVAAMRDTLGESAPAGSLTPRRAGVRDRQEPGGDRAERRRDQRCKGDAGGVGAGHQAGYGESQYRDHDPDGRDPELEVTGTTT
jgi:hydrogenase maturation protease